MVYSLYLWQKTRNAFSRDQSYRQGNFSPWLSPTFNFWNSSTINSGWQKCQLFGWLRQWRLRCTNTIASTNSKTKKRKKEHALHYIPTCNAYTKMTNKAEKKKHYFTLTGGFGKVDMKINVTTYEERHPRSRNRGKEKP